VEADVVDDAPVSLAVPLHLRQDQEEAPADSEVGDEDVDYGHRGYQEATADERKLPDGIVHGASL